MLGNPNKQTLIAIGKILTSQGNKGELRVYPLTDFPERFQVNDEVILVKDSHRERFKISSVWHHKDWVILGLSGINSMDAARKLKGALIKVPADEVHELPEGHYYVFQLIGLSVYTEGQEFIGVLKEVFSATGNDIYQVVHPESNREILLPATKECVKKIDLQRKLMTVKLLPGLLEQEQV